MPVNYRPHHQYLHPQTGLPVTEHVADYVMLGNASQHFIIQQGQVYLGNTAIPESQYPAWLWDGIRALTPAARRSVGFELPEDKIQSLDELPADFRTLFDSLAPELKAELIGKKASRMPQDETSPLPETSGMSPLSDGLKNDSEGSRSKIWTCDRCETTVELRKKGVHLAAHARADKHAKKVNF